MEIPVAASGSSSDFLIGMLNDFWNIRIVGNVITN